MKKVLLILVIIMLALSMFSLVTATNVGIQRKDVNEENEQSEALTDGIIENAKVDEEKDVGIGLIAAALATGLACIGSGIAVAVVASSAVGAISEKPELLGKTVIFAGLAEGIAIYGLIISIMILDKI